MSNTAVLVLAAGSTIQYCTPSGLFHSYQNLSELGNQEGRMFLENTMLLILFGENRSARS